MLVQKVAPIQTDLDDILSIADAKTFMRILSEDEDTLIQSMIKGAIDEVNNRTNLNLATATFELYLSSLQNEIKLPKNPIQSVEKVEYMDADGNYVLLGSANYYLWKLNGQDILVFDYFPATIDHKKAVKITFKSGFVADNFPGDIKSWLKVRVSTLYEYREEFIVGTIVGRTEHVDSVLDRYRIRSF